MRGSDDTEEIKLYLLQFAPAKRLICLMKDSLERCTSDTEKEQILSVIADKEKLVKEIYDLVFRLPDSIMLEIVELYYFEDKSVYEVCSTLHISKSTYHAHHKKALKQLKEMRDKK